MHAASHTPENDTGAADRPALTVVENPPGDAPLPAPAAPARRPIVAAFAKLAVFSKDTGRWHRPTRRGDASPTGDDAKGGN